jgi:hypothetical protein
MNRAGKAWLRSWLAGVAMVLVGTTLALPAGASARPRPAVSLSLARASEGAPISFTWSARHVGSARLVVQRPVGTAHTWKTMLKLSGTGGTGELPGVALGRYRYRLAALKGHRVLAQEVAGVSVFGQVPLATLLGEVTHEGVWNTPTTAFPYVATFDQGAAFSVQHNHCVSVHISFLLVRGGLNSSVDKSGFSGTLTVVQESRDPVSATVPYEGIGSVDAQLAPGQTWGVNTSASPEYLEFLVNGYAVCDSTESFFGS